MVGTKKKLIITSIVILVILISSFLYYVSDIYYADSKALAALSSNSDYTVYIDADYISFTPTTNQSSTGVIIYPGAKIQPESYSILASDLAKNGYKTIIVKMPFNLAFFDTNKADMVIKENKNIDKWVIVGHSLGGVFASDYAVDHQDKIKGVIYLAAYPGANASEASFKALSIHGSEDGLTSAEDIKKNQYKFPANTKFVTIIGGNHFNFGNYGLQEGDNNSTITREEQQNQTLNFIIEFLKSI